MSVYSPVKVYMASASAKPLAHDYLAALTIKYNASLIMNLASLLNKNLKKMSLYFASISSHLVLGCARIHCLINGQVTQSVFHTLANLHKKDTVMKKSLAVSSLIASLIATPSFADNANVEAYLGAAHYFWDEDRNLDDANSLEGGIEVPISERVSLEAWLSDFEADIENSSNELDGRRYALGGLYHLTDNDSYRPFVSLGGAHQEFEANNTDADETLVYLGVGAKKIFDNNLILRGELLAMNSIDNELTDLGARIAIGYAFGRTTSAAAPVVEKKPAPVASKAAPAPAEAKPEPAPAAVPVAAAEPVIQKDSDNDGVIDANDKCSETDAAFKVDANGCPIKLIKAIEIAMSVTFKSNSAEIADGQADIKNVADFLKKYTDTSITVEGHTDDRGRAAYNKQLSQRRADAIKEILTTDYAIDAARVTATGFGEEQPIMSNDTAEGRAANRRVVGEVSANIETHEAK